MRITSVVGARPQFIKLAPVAGALAAAGHGHRIVHTGQHYDVEMSDVFFDELRIPEPDVHLGVGSASHGRQTAAMLEGVERVLLDAPPDWVVTYGDTNSTIAAALAAVKVHVPTAHLEAGLRSFNRRMPEEHNRVLTDHASDLLLVPSRVGMSNLEREGLAGRSVHVGDVMIDVLMRVRDAVERDPPTLPDAVPADDFVLATVHRAENTDDPGRLAAIVEGLASMPVPVVLAAHPRLRERAATAGVPLDAGALRPVAPLSYRTLVAALLRARAVVTDSGGLQKEAFALRVPCATVRTETEWLETLETGWNALVDDLADLPEVALRAPPPPTGDAPYGEGDAAGAVVTALTDATVER